MKSNNPFVVNFGLKPNNYISRLRQSEEIISSFQNSNSNNVYVITGLRGCGKTVMLSHVSEYFENEKDWIVVEVISNLDILEQLASKLYDSSLLHKIFTGKTFGFSFSGVSFSISGNEPVTNVISLLEIIIEKIAKKNKKILICIDEVAKNDYMKSFAQTFQLLLRKRFPIYLLMTGLYQNVYELENDKTLTFLYRCPKIMLEPLNLRSITYSYINYLKIDEDFAVSLAKMTKGYAYAYQVLGYLVYEHEYKNINDELLFKFDHYLEDFVYDKVWTELSEKDKKVLMAFDSEITDVSLILNKTKMKKNIFSTYRDRLIKRGILLSTEYGKLEMSLPRFYEFVQFKK